MEDPPLRDAFLDEMLVALGPLLALEGDGVQPIIRVAGDHDLLLREINKHVALGVGPAQMPILTDRGNAVASRFGLTFALPDYLRVIYASFPLDLAKYNGDASWTLPMPARFVIDRAGIVRATESDPDYTSRPEPEDTLAALRALR